MTLYKILFIILISFLPLFSLDFKVASYNVENLFDLKNDGTEYREYKPYSKYWDKKSFQKKLQNISKVIKDLDADILALQEIESKNALISLNKLTKYKYYKFLKNKHSSIGVAILSKFKIIESKRIIVDKYDKYSRDILRIKFILENKPLYIYINHWRSKRASESYRIRYATALKNDYETLADDIDYIILGDLNSNYNEYQTFKYNKKLNNTYGITGINQVLNTTMNNNFISKENINNFNKKVHYNLWLDIKSKNRYSTKFKKELNTPDNIIIPKSLLDNNCITYIKNSFNVYKPKYLFRKSYIYRWNKYNQNGFSDHLPIFALFSTEPQKFTSISKKQEVYNIDYLYTLEYLNQPIDLKNIVVIYKSAKLAIIKENINSKAIMIYNPPIELKVGYRYNIIVHKIDYFNGLKEIKSVSIIDKLTYQKDYKNYRMTINNIDIFDKRNQNQIIKDLKGTYKKRYLYFNNNGKLSKIRLYFKKGISLPKQNSKITIKKAQITIYKSNIQLTINQQSDFI